MIIFAVIFFRFKNFAIDIKPNEKISQGSIISSDEKVYYENGDVMDMTGTIYHSDGTVTLPSGSLRDIYGIVHYPDGSIKLPNGTTYYINGNIEYGNYDDLNVIPNPILGQDVGLNKNTGDNDIDDKELTKGMWEYDPLINNWKYKYRVNGIEETIYKNQWIVSKNLEGIKNWFAADEDGNMVIGWVKYNGSFYYMSKKPSNRGEMIKGETTIDGEKYIFDDETGELIKGDEPTRNFTVIGAKNHKLGKDGVWKRYNTGERYFVEYYKTLEGKILEIPPSGWYMVDGKYYFMDKYGIPQVGLIIYDGKYYYMNEDGSMLEGGEKIIDNTIYIFDKATGACLETR